MSHLRLDDAIIDVEQSLIALDRADCQDSLAEFIRQAWHVVEPGQPYVHGWHIDALCEHLEAITDGVEVDGQSYNRLLVNVPPGTMKSLTIGVFWPAWEWGPCEMPHLRYVCASHSQNLAIRDSMKMRRLVMSDWYRERWPHVVLTADQNAKTKFENTATGFREAAASGSITGSRGDRVIIDDPHSVEGAGSDQMRQTTIEWFLEAVPTRVNNPDTSAIVVVMQRLHEEDVSGVILDKDLGYDHLMLPMRFDPSRAKPTLLGYEDPRDEPGELLFPERFPLAVVDRDERVMGPYATAGQFQQLPVPRGGGIIQVEWWETWEGQAYPPMDYIIASFDGGFTEAAENDPSALTVWGIFSSDVVAQNAHGERVFASPSPRVMLMDAWAERLELHKVVQKIAKTCKAMRVDKLLIENKASGYPVAQEIRRLFGHEDWAVQLLDPKGQDKTARLYSVQHIFAEGMVYAPDRPWASMVINQIATFPKGKHDDLTDTASQALRHLRDLGLLQRGEEITADVRASMIHRGKPPPPLYPV